jgi:hypothetical protein
MATRVKVHNGRTPAKALIDAGKQQIVWHGDHRIEQSEIKLSMVHSLHHASNRGSLVAAGHLPKGAVTPHSAKHVSKSPTRPWPESIAKVAPEQRRVEVDKTSALDR